MIPNGTRDADAAGRALGLETDNHVHCFPVQVSPIRNRVTDVDADPEADGAIGRLVTIEPRHKLLHLHGAAPRTVDAVEDNQQGVARCLDDPAVVFGYGGIDQVGTENTQALKGARVIQSDQTAVTNHIGVEHSDQLPPIW